MADDRRPDWEWWKYIPSGTILEAVALSMDTAPRLLSYVHELSMWMVDYSPAPREFQKRLTLAVRNLTTLSAWGTYPENEPELCQVELPKAAAVFLSWGWKIPPEMAALAEATPVAEAIKKSQNQSEAAIERHSKRRERTLAAVLWTIATADRELYIRSSDQSIIVSKLAQLVEDNRLKYGNILKLEGIEDIVGKILNGTYFSEGKKGE